jgi:hypothetical protein
MLRTEQEEQAPKAVNHEALARIDRIASAIGKLSAVYDHHADQTLAATRTEIRQTLLKITFEEAKEIELAVQREEARLARLLYEGLVSPISYSVDGIELAPEE